ncbi:MAG: hypothetical protein QXU18_05445 [Thermoplasmatales archaeon]
MDSICSDRPYTSPSCINESRETKEFAIPKKNSKLNGSLKLKNILKNFVLNRMQYLEQYHQISNSASGFPAEKKILDWNIARRIGAIVLIVHCSKWVCVTIYSIG